MKWSAWLLIVLISVGLGLRLWQFESRLSFDFDNEYFAWEAKKILVDHKLTLVGQEASTQGVFIAPGYTYLTAGIYALYKGNPIAGGVTAVLFGVATTVMLYLVGKNIKDEVAGLIAAGFYQLSLFGMDWDWGGSALNGMLFIPLLWLYGWLTRKWWLNFLAVGLAFHFHPTAIILAICSLVLALKHRQEIARKELFAGLVLVLICLSPLALFDLRHGFSITKHILAVSAPDNIKDQSVVALLRVLLNSVVGWVDASQYATSYKVVMPVLVLMAISGWRKRATQGRFWLAFWLLLTTTGAALLAYPRHVTDYYSMVVYGPSLVAVAVVIAGLKKTVLKIGAAVFLIWFGLTNFHLWQNFSKSHNLQAKKKVVAWIIDHAQGRRFDISDSFITLGYNTGYNYLFHWQGASLDKLDPQVIYSLVIPPGYKDITPKYEAAGIGVIWDEIP
ncbi:MAG: glycosyltransferase family 39 protein [bacterium]|nr:glycosyltransferase family 39 protein [bacterium]